MTPVFCATTHNPPETYGDCLRACIASVLDKPSGEVPHFAHDGADPRVVLKRCREYLNTTGHTVFISQYPPVDRSELFGMMSEDNPGVIYLLFGLVAEGGGHVVVCQGGRVVHNPALFGCWLVAPPPGGWLVWVVTRV